MKLLSHIEETVVRRAHWLEALFLSGWLWGTAWVGGAEPAAANQQFEAASKALADGWYERAATEFESFLRQFPNSSRAAEAVYDQAQARFHLKQYDRVTALVKQRMDRAGALAESYRLLLADCSIEQGDFNAAALEYGRFLHDYPKSNVRLNAAYGEAYAKFKSGDFARTIALLNEPGQPFQKSLAGNTNLTLVGQGYLLLAEAFNAQRQYRAAEEALQKLGNSNPSVRFEWKRVYLLARTELLDGHPTNALQSTGRLFDLALASGAPLLQVQSLRLMGEVQELIQPSEAFHTYEKITQLKGAPPEEQRKALLKLVDLTINQNQVTNAIQRLETFVAQNPQDVALDLLILTLGELHLKEFYLQADKTKASGVALDGPWRSLLQSGRTNFDRLINSFTNSGYMGKAYLDRGWCLWEEAERGGEGKKLAQARESFQRASDRLPRSEDQAVARFKWADCQFESGDYAAALQNYRTLLDQYSSLDFPRKASLFEQALYQTARAQIQLNRLAEARQTADQLLAKFPSSDLADNCLLSLGEAHISQRQPVQARAILQRLIRTYPKSDLLPDAHLALARTFIQENNWPGAIHEYDGWVKQFTNQPALPQVEFERASANYHAGLETNAFVLFKNFVARFPTNSLAPLAQFWTGDYFFRKGNYPAAEETYQRLFARATNAPGLLLAYQAKLMAARSALRRESPKDARIYLTELVNDPNCPPSLLPEGYFCLGDVFTKEPSLDPHNALTNYTEAYKAFNKVVTLYPTNRFAPLAEGRMGDCLLQLASQTPRLYADAAKHYKEAVESPLADVATRSQAEIGLGMVLEKQAALQPPSQQQALLSEALDHYLNVIYERQLRPGTGEKPDLFWVKEAGLAACRLAETLDRKPEAAKLCQRLETMIPSMRLVWEKKVQALLEPADSARN